VFRFAHPEYLGMLPVLAAAAWFVYRRRAAAGILFAPLSRLPLGGRTWRAYAALLLPALYLAGTALAVLALARPQELLSRSRRSTNAVAIEMVVDVSGSMEALDLSERTAAGVRLRTRLDAVKDAFAEFVSRRPDDLIGLVSFGGYASTRAPLTLDHRALEHVLRGVEIPGRTFDDAGQILNQEELLTAVGDALATACGRLRNAETKSRVVVLLSDGESNTGIIQPEEAARAAKKMGVRVYTIGVGTTGSAPFQGKDMFGRTRIFTADVVLDEALLRQIAETTGGRYFNVRDPRGLEKAVAEIDALEKTEIARDILEQFQELFPWFLAPAAVLVLLGAGLNMAVAGRIV
jgi:Ca-activated chloride channel family protein